MKTRMRRLVMTGFVLTAISVSWNPAYAFFPFGSFDQSNVLWLETWSVKDFDTNDDGNVTQGEGIPLYYEGGKQGFNPDEMTVIEDACGVWSDVSTTFVAFRRADVFYDPMLPNDDGATNYDSFPMIFLQIGPEDVTDPEREEADTELQLDGATLGQTFIYYVPGDNTTETIPGPGGQGYLVSAGTIVDADIVINYNVVRQTASYGSKDENFKATLVHELGHLLGLGHTPLNNARLSESATVEGYANFLEKEAVWMSDASHAGRYVGATPTMFLRPVFTFDSSCNCYKPCALDLSPDDVSGISWLYPRRSQPNFFSMVQQARTHVRTGSTGQPTFPIVGGHVVAWADTDNDPVTARVPLFSTMTGLYVPQADESEGTVQRRGEFAMTNLWKQLELPNGAGSWFNASYTFTLSPLNGLSLTRQSPPGESPDTFASIIGAANEYNTLFPSEVFHEAENVFDMENKDSGTPVMWDFAGNTVVSADSGRALDNVLSNRPMFGDPLDVCILNVVSSSSSSSGNDTGGTTDGGGDGGGGTTEGDAGGGGTTTEGDTGGTDGNDEEKMAGFLGGNGPSDGSLLPGAMVALRSFRDNYLLESHMGTALVGAYYQATPRLAKFLVSHDALFQTWKKMVSGFAWTLFHPLQTAVLGGLTILAGCIAWRHGRRLWRRLFWAGLVLLVVGLPAGAFGMLADMSTEKMVSGADAVVAGKVVSQSSRWAGTAPRVIVTDVVVEVQDVAKGRLNKSSQVTFTVPGGEVNGLKCRASESPEFKPGEKSVLFLKENKSGLAVFAGLYGKMLVETDKGTGAEYVKGDNLAATDNLQQDAAKLKPETAGKANEPARLPLNDYMGYLREIGRKQRRAQ